MMKSTHPRHRRSTVRLVTVSLTIYLLAVSPYLASGQRSQAPAATPLPQLRARIAEYMAARANVTGFSGAVLVAREGQVVFRGAFGDANREFAVPNAPDTKFRIGSVSKQFTAAAVLLLAQRGSLTLTL